MTEHRGHIHHGDFACSCHPTEAIEEIDHFDEDDAPTVEQPRGSLFGTWRHAALAAEISAT
jgi:hypothetical protein